MLTRGDIQFIKSLADKRARDAEGVFVVEGRKAVDELGALNVREVFRVGENISAREMERISFLKTPTDVLAVVEKPLAAFSAEALRGRLVLALDEVQNPGNVGTIIRLADWFGISDVLCSGATADVWGPKVVQATMGSLARVAVHYGELPEMIEAVGGEVYGAFLDGENIYRAELSARGVVVLGSEGRGISAAVERLVTRRIVIPRLGGGGRNADGGAGCAESLNVAIAAGIICSQFRKNV